MPRRVADYAAQFGDWNLLISCFAFLLGAAQLVFLYNMIVSWRFGPRADGQPVAGEDDRVAGLLAAADLQLRRDPARRRRPLRVRRARRPPRDHGRRGGRGAPEPASRATVGSRDVSAEQPTSSGRCWSSSTRSPAAASCCRRSASGPRPGRRRRRRGAAEPAGGRPAGRRRRAARRRPSRVEVTMAVLAEFGIESVGEVMDPDPSLALDDAVRAHEPGRGAALLPLRDPLRPHPQGPGRVGAGALRARDRRSPTSRCGSTTTRSAGTSIHTLVVATQTVASPDLVARLKERAAERPHRYTIICPRSERRQRERGRRATSPRPWPSSTAPTSTRPASR